MPNSVEPVVCMKDTIPYASPEGGARKKKREKKKTSELAARNPKKTKTMKVNSRVASLVVFIVPDLCDLHVCISNLCVHYIYRRPTKGKGWK